MSTIRSLLRKDRSQFAMLAGLTAAACLIEELLVVQPLSYLRNGNAINEALSLLPVLKWPAIFGCVGAVAQADSPVGDKAFWKSRPIGSLELFGEKAAFLAAVIVLPSFISRIISCLWLGCGPRTAVAFAGEAMLGALDAVFACWLLAAVTRTLLQMTMSVFGLVILSTLTAMLFRQYAPSISLLPSLPTPTPLGVLTTGVVFSTLLGLALALHYRRASIARTCLYGFVACFSPLLVGYYWPVVPKATLQAEPATMPSSELFSIKRIERSPHPELTAQLSTLTFTFSQLAPGEEFEIEAIEERWRRADGRTLELKATTPDGYAHPRFHSASRLVTWLKDNAGVEVMPEVQAGAYSSTSFSQSFAPHWPTNEQPRSYSKPEVMALLIRRYHSRLLFRMPLQAGATVTTDQTRWYLEQTNSLPDGGFIVNGPNERSSDERGVCGLTLLALTPDSVLSPKRPDLVGYRYGIVIGAHGSAFMEVPYTEAGFSDLGNSVAARARTLIEGTRVVAGENFEKPSDAWLAQAEFFGIAADPLSTVRVPVSADVNQITPDSR